MTRQIVIDRKTWARGQRTSPEGYIKTNMLLDSDGMKCCLGFAAQQLCNAADNQILNHTSPSNTSDVFMRGLPELIEINNYPTDSCVTDTKLTSRLIDANDHCHANDFQAQENKIVELFKSIGVECSFI
jgi:hypothetical protein